MKKKFLTILDAIDNEKASFSAQLFSGFFWCLICGSFAACCLIFAAIFR